MEFTIDANPQPSAMEVTWIVLNTETIATLMPEPSPKTPDRRKYQLKPHEVASTEAVDSVSLKIQFRLSDGRHGGRWTWPVQRHEKGHWIVDNHLGSGVDQPKIEDTW